MSGDVHSPSKGEPSWKEVNITCSFIFLEPFKKIKMYLIKISHFNHWDPTANPSRNNYAQIIDKSSSRSKQINDCFYYLA